MPRKQEIRYGTKVRYVETLDDLKDFVDLDDNTKQEIIRTGGGWMEYDPGYQYRPVRRFRGKLIELVGPYVMIAEKPFYIGADGCVYLDDEDSDY